MRLKLATFDERWNRTPTDTIRLRENECSSKILRLGKADKVFLDRSITFYESDTLETNRI